MLSDILLEFNLSNCTNVQDRICFAILGENDEIYSDQNQNTNILMVLVYSLLLFVTERDSLVLQTPSCFQHQILQQTEKEKKKDFQKQACEFFNLYLY